MVGLASLALGAVQAGIGLYQAANAEDPQQYQETSEMRAARSRAAQMAQSGFTPAEKAAFKQSLAATGNTAYRRGVDLAGGSLAGALRAGINAQQLNAQNQFAGQDAQLHRQNIAQSNSLEQGYQGLKNAQVDQQRQVAQQQAAAASQSINSGLGNMGSALNLQQALKWQPNTVGGTNNPITQNQEYSYSDIPTMTPSGQVAPVGLGNYQIGANSNVQGYQPNMFYNPNTTYNYGLTNPFLGQYGIR